MESSVCPGLPGAALEDISFCITGVSLISVLISGSISATALSAAVSGSNSDSALNCTASDSL